MENRRRSRSKLFTKYLLLSRSLLQVTEPSEERSPSVQPFSEADEVADDELKEELDQQKLEEWRKEVRGLSQEQLIKVALIMKIVANRQTAL